ncbi:MAG: heme-binding protein [Acholeplasmataceae bacterium]|nr:heme-binding protein [Acholeplasmataceae bacterium]
MSKYESPDYQVVKKDGSFEIRRYKEFYTTSVDENKLSGYSGFGLLFSYISGNNKKNEKIQMTVPVINEFNNDQMSMEFVVPSKYYNQEIPTPNNEKLVTKFYPEHYAVALRFTGLSTAHHINKEKERLTQWLIKNKIESTGRYRLARFNPPFSIPFLRHNEIFIEVDYQE